MPKILLLIGAMFAAMNIAGSLEAFTVYYDIIVGGMIALLVSPLIINQFN